MDQDTLPTRLFDDEPGAQSDVGLIDNAIEFLAFASRHIALLAAWIATCGSLFLSEVIGWTPCLLCWYQRILMYPLTIILAVGIWRRDRGVHLYVLPLSIIGSGTSLYHYLLIKTNWFPPPPCTVGVPCTVDYLNWFGFVNIPFLALTAFVIITCMIGMRALLDVEESIAEGPLDDTDYIASAWSSILEGERLMVVMITVGVILTFMVASTLV